MLRPAVTADVEELLRVEREANLPALHDVFRPEQFPVVEGPGMTFGMLEGSRSYGAA